MHKRLLVSIVAVWLGATGTLVAQTATSAMVAGTVRDSSAAVVPAAVVELLETGTKAKRQQATNVAGQYVFPSVPPGDYEITVTMTGFRAASMPQLKVEVTKSYTMDFTLEVGQVAETVEVNAELRTELQTVDATVGNVLSGRTLGLMPALTRTANELLALQPGVVPGSGEVTGARNDQSTFALDGIDVTNQSIGGLGTYMYLGIEGVEEFRFSVANPNATFGRGAGGQVSLVSRRGSNEFHGGVFWYHQNDNLNANSWTNNRTAIKKTELKDNRYGFRAGGPIWKDKTFFFVNHDGRRFPRSSDTLRRVPTDSLRQGNLRFRDASGNVVTYPLASSMLCGPQGSEPCDPRSLGLSPTIAAHFSQLPAGNDPSEGDGLNTIGFRGTVVHPIKHDFYFAKIDHSLTDAWRIDASVRYFREIAADSAQLSIVGGNVQSVRNLPARQNMENIGISGMFRPNLTGEFRFARVRVRTALDTLRPNASAARLNIPGTQTPEGAIALDLGARGGLGATGLLNEPIDVDTQVARRQVNDNRNYQTNADLNWIKGRHTFQFGSHLRYLPTRHQRDDKVLGSLGALVAQIDADAGSPFQIPPSSRPPTCGAVVTTNCLAVTDVQQWNRLYASALGMIDNVSVLAVRDGEFKPLPYGSLIESDTSGLWAPEFYLQDVWRLRPSFTLTLGVNYGWQTAPKEKLGRYTIQINKDTGEFLTSGTFFPARRQAAEAGRIFNPEYGFLPIKSTGGKQVFATDWNNIGPHLAAAWNPRFSDGFLGKLFGDRRTVIRGGYSLIFDRQNTVQSVIIPSLGVAFGQTLNVTAPACNASGAGGSGCDPRSTNAASSIFRVGRDGVIPRPVVPQQSVPVSPPWCRTGSAGCLFPEILSFQVDPFIQVGKHHAIDLTWQRELPVNMLLELSYVGRYANNLTQSMNLSQAPYMQADPASRQTFAQAFDNVAAALRAGTPVTSQPFFENQVPGGTARMAASAANFINGNINGLFLTMDLARMGAGLQPFNNYMSQMAFLRSSTGSSNYNGLLATLRKRMSRGLTYDLTYTFSRSLDQFGAVQNAASVMPNNFDLNAEYGPSDFDTTHIFNGHYLYELPTPFRGKIGPLDKVLGGWHVSGIFTARSGAPRTVTQGGQVWGGSLFLGFASGAIPTVNPKTFSNSAVDGVKGSGNTGTNSDPANRGTGLNLFSDPETVFKSFRRVNLSQDGRSGRSNPLRGMPRWNLDFSIGKRTSIKERVDVRFNFDFFNIFNKVDFNDPGLSLLDSRGFGVISSQFVPANRQFGSRWIQFGMRVEF